jgi:hypothetical protein
LEFEPDRFASITGPRVHGSSLAPEAGVRVGGALRVCILKDVLAETAFNLIGVTPKRYIATLAVAKSAQIRAARKAG